MIRIIKKLTVFILTAVFSMQTFIVVANTDDFIETDPAANTYAGRIEAGDTRSNLIFTDMQPFDYAMESVARNGALNLIKGYEDLFYPEREVTRGDAISHVMRALGYEKEAIVQASGIGAQLPGGVSTDELLELAYLNLASTMEIITPQNYQDALYEVQNEQTLRNAGDAAAADAFAMPQNMYEKNVPATREELAYWIYAGLMTIDDALWENPAEVQGIYTYPDWTDISAGNLMAAESMILNDIMAGSPEGFLPDATVDRIMLSQTLRNMDDFYYNAMGYVESSGTVGSVIDSQNLDTTLSSVERQILVRRMDGLKDVISFRGELDKDGNTVTYDAVVFKNNQVVGLQALEEGDVIEYIADPATNTVLYAEVLGTQQTTEIQGILSSVDMANRTVAIEESDGNLHYYQFIGGMGQVEGVDSFFIIDGARVNINALPVGSLVSLSLSGNTVIACGFLGEPIVTPQGGGVVLENDPAFGYLTVLEHNGVVVTKRYYQNEMTVQKKDYYETTDSIGYIAEVFPYFGYNPRAAVIADVDPGDLVFYETDPNDPNVITSISASSNYTARYGKIRTIQARTGFTEVMVEYEDHQTAMFNIPNEIYVGKDGRPAEINQLVLGDWVKLLVNSAVIAPGLITEAVMELSIEGPERLIGTIIKGRLSDVDPIQDKLYISEAMTLAKTGWTDYNDVSGFDLSGNDIEYYDNGRRISKDEAVKFFRRSDATVYLGLEDSYLGSLVKVVSFRNSRDDALEPDTVVDAAGNGTFSVLSVPEAIATDPGTIVVRNGRLVTGRDVFESDYARVVLNGPGMAAVVDISEAPDSSRFMIARTRVESIDEGQSFSVPDMYRLVGTEWAEYTPVPFTYEIDGNTVFIDDEGYFDQSLFMDYGENSVTLRPDNYPYYYVVSEGTHALFVTQTPELDNVVRGTVYETEDGAFYINGAEYADYSNSVQAWTGITPVANGTLRIVSYVNSIFIKNDRVVSMYDLEPGDRVEVYVPSEFELPVTAGSDVDGYIVIVRE